MLLTIYFENLTPGCLLSVICSALGLINMHIYLFKENKNVFPPCHAEFFINKLILLIVTMSMTWCILSNPDVWLIKEFRYNFPPVSNMVLHTSTITRISRKINKITNILIYSLSFYTNSIN